MSPYTGTQEDLHCPLLSENKTTNILADVLIWFAYQHFVGLTNKCKISNKNTTMTPNIWTNKLIMLIPNPDFDNHP